MSAKNIPAGQIGGIMKICITLPSCGHLAASTWDTHGALGQEKSEKLQNLQQFFFAKYFCLTRNVKGDDKDPPWLAT